MFNILQEWLTSKLGVKNCWNLNFNNVGERFKDGVLFARLLQKYQVIPDCYVQDFKKTNSFTACLRNIKSINLWLKFLDIVIEDGATHEIANGQSIAVTKLLYQLYLKFETLKQSHKHDNIKIKKIEPINRKNVINFYKRNDLSILSNHGVKQYKENTLSTNNEIFNGLKLCCSLKGIEYTATDVFKSKKNNTPSKNTILTFLQNNMNYFYDLFLKNLNSKLFVNDFDEKYNDICRNTIFYVLNIKEDTIITGKLNESITNVINNLNLKNNIHSKI